MKKPLKYQRKIIGVEKNLGFMYVPAQAQELMPAKTGKFSFLLQGNKKAIKLNYNAEHKRIFGLTPWYKKLKVTVNSVLDIELNSGLMKISLAEQKKITSPSVSYEDMDKGIDISGLSSTEKGNIVEDRIKELILLYGQGLLNVYKPVIDSRGIDLIVMRDGVFMPIFLQVKSRFNTVKRGTLLIDVGENTFTKHHSFYIIGVAFNPNTLEIEDKLLLIPSKDYDKQSTIVSAKNRRVKRMNVSMKEDSTGKGTQYFIKKSELVENLMDKFEEMEDTFKKLSGFIG
jgi:hypothetical protein